MSKQGKSKDLAEELKEYLSSYGIVKREDIINAYESQRSKRTIIRRLDDLKEAGFIEKLNAEQVEKYGIEVSNKKFKYIVLKETLELIKHIDSIFEDFDDGDFEDKLSVLAEVDSYKKVYVLTPLQLDILVKNLTEDDTELTYQLLTIIYDYIVYKKTPPKDVSVLLDKLRLLLAKAAFSSQGRSTLRGYIIALLGIYIDRTVIDQLIQDANTMDDLSDVKDEYDKNYTATVIENHRTELFNLERSLRKSGKEKNAKILSQIRYQAKKNLGIADHDEGITISGTNLTGVDLK